MFKPWSSRVSTSRPSLDSDKKLKAFYRKFVGPAWNAYNELGNRGEAVNRAALHAQLGKQGMSHGEASLQARVLMDFSKSGSFATVRSLTQVVPFLNARLQGLYKLGRNTFWWFKIGEVAFRIPNPFAVGEVGALAERGFELFFDNEMTGKRFRSQVLTILSDNLSMNPMRQMLKPVVEVWANKDFLRDRPIEGGGWSA